MISEDKKFTGYANSITIKNWLDNLPLRVVSDEYIKNYNMRPYVGYVTPEEYKQLYARKSYFK